jgi:hypothetical protein
MRAFLKLTLEAAGAALSKFWYIIFQCARPNLPQGSFMRRRPIRGQALWDRDLAAARPFRTPGVSNSSQTTGRYEPGGIAIFPEADAKKMAPKIGAIEACLERYARSQRGFDGRSDAGTGNVAVANGHLRIGHQHSVDRREQAAEQGAGGREGDGSSSGHWIPFS